MLSIFRVIIDRVKALFAVSAAQELESEILLRDAERKAELLRQADRYDGEGLRGIATHLRLGADAVTVQRPLAGVLPALEHLAGDPHAHQITPLLPGLSGNGTPDTPHKSLPAPKKKGGKSR
jgi:hypothetical protein